MTKICPLKNTEGIYSSTPIFFCKINHFDLRFFAYLDLHDVALDHLAIV